MKCMPSLATVLLAVSFAACSSGTSAVTATPADSPYQVRTAGSFYRDYTGPQRPAILALAAGGAYLLTSGTIALQAQMAGPIAAGGPNYYVWGFDRGGASSRTAPFPDEPNVKFDAVLVVTVDAAGSPSAVVNLLDGKPAQPVPAVSLPAPETLAVQVPLALLPSTGAQPGGYTWNLWPRSGVGGSAAAQIASFIPENAMAPLITR